MGSESLLDRVESNPKDLQEPAVRPAEGVFVSRGSRCPGRWVVSKVLGVLLTLPLAVEAETFAVQSVDYRDYQSLFFDPHYLQINPGDSVHFSVNNFDHQPQSVFIPGVARPWKAETGQNITVEFNLPGVYLFDCAYHNVMGMMGVIVVGRPDNLAQAREFFRDYRDRVPVLNKDRLDYLWAQGGLLDPD